ncbi:hypothetical protein [Vibrio sp. TRT 17S01]|uniref:hypothetical protein n=1 Tax=Vibrio sp. TRT 17S01 TaxID=3418505 RepID=UPI003CF66455
MIWETLERVNRLRQEALASPEFVESAKAHEKALQHELELSEPTKTRKRVKKAKSLADIYHEVEFGPNQTGTQH